MQHITVRSQEDLLEEFIQRCQDAPPVDRKHIYQTIFGVNARDLEYLIYQGGILFHDDVGEMTKEAKAYRGLQLGPVVERTLSVLADTYPTNASLVVSIYPMTPGDSFGIDRLGGVSGWVDWDGHTMGLVVHASPKSLLALRSTVVHEYHHHYRIMAMGMDVADISLMEKLIREGMGEHFVETHLGKAFLGPWVAALSSEDAYRLWHARYLDHLHDQGEKVDPYVFGGGETDLPLWAGYSLGYWLVAWYRRTYSTISMAELSLVDSEEFIKTVP